MMEDFIGTYGNNLIVAVVGVGVALLVLAIALWLLRRRSGSAPFIRGGRNRQPRLQVLDATAVDARRRLVLVRRDNVEHLVMIGGPTDIVIESGIGAIPIVRDVQEPEQRRCRVRRANPREPSRPSPRNAVPLCRNSSPSQRQPRAPVSQEPESAAAAAGAHRTCPSPATTGRSNCATAVASTDTTPNPYRPNPYHRRPSQSVSPLQRQGKPHLRERPLSRTAALSSGCPSPVQLPFCRPPPHRLDMAGATQRTASRRAFRARSSTDTHTGRTASACTDESGKGGRRTAHGYRSTRFCRARAGARPIQRR